MRPKMTFPMAEQEYNDLLESSTSSSKLKPPKEYLTMVHTD